MNPQAAERLAKIGMAHHILDNYTDYDHDRESVRWALNFIGHERHRNEIVDIALWLQT